MKAALILGWCVIGLPVDLTAEEVYLRWREIPTSLVAGRKVEVGLATGGVLHGKALSLGAGGLRMDVRRIAGSVDNYQSGECLVSPHQIRTVKVNRTGNRGRIIGTAIGGGLTALTIGIVYGLGLGYIEGAAAPAGVAVAALIPTGVGYLLGWVRDRKSTTIHVRPETSEAVTGFAQMVRRGSAGDFWLARELPGGKSTSARLPVQLG